MLTGGSAGGVRVRFAYERDVEQLLEVYSHYVENTCVSFEYVTPSVSEFVRRVAEFGSMYPWLVCENDGSIIAYAYAHRHAQRQAYSYGAELSVYCHREWLGKGLGLELYTALIELLRAQRVCSLYAGVALPNKGSEALHRQLGFEVAGIWHATGWKHGKWHDVAWFERRLAEDERPPQEIIPIGKVDSAIVVGILDECAQRISKRLQN